MNATEQHSSAPPDDRPWLLRDRAGGPRALAVLFGYELPRGTGGQLRDRGLVHALRTVLPTDVVSVTSVLAPGHPAACDGEPAPPFDAGPDAPFTVLYCAEAARTLVDLLRRERYALVVIGAAVLYTYAQELREAAPGAVLVDLHNAEADLYQELTAHPDWQRLSGEPVSVAAGIARAERHLVGLADLVTVPSALDAAKVRARYPDAPPASVVPNAVQLLPAPERAGVIRQATFTGALDYFPNSVAALEIGRQVGPALQGAVPGLRVVVAGRNPPPPVVEALRGGPVELVADPQDIAPFFLDAVAIVPLRLGGGTRLKILQAFAAGTPVVATAKGIEGIEAVPGRHYLAAESPQEFAAAVAELVRDPVADLGRRRAAWELCAQRYSWDALPAAVKQALAPLRLPATP